MRRLTIAEHQQRDSIARRITVAMAHANLSQRALAEELGVSQSLVSQVARGVFPGHKHLPGIAKACGVPVEYLRSGIGWSGGPTALLATGADGRKPGRQLSRPNHGPAARSLPTRLLAGGAKALADLGGPDPTIVALAEPVGRKVVQDVADGSGLRLGIRRRAEVYLVIVERRS